MWVILIWKRVSPFHLFEISFVNECHCEKLILTFYDGFHLNSSELNGSCFHQAKERRSLKKWIKRNLSIITRIQKENSLQYSFSRFPSGSHWAIIFFPFLQEGQDYHQPDTTKRSTDQTYAFTIMLSFEADLKQHYFLRAPHLLPQVVNTRF